MSSPALLTLLRALPADVGPAVRSIPADAWAALPRDAERHGLSGLLSDALGKKPEAVPAPVLAALRGSTRNAVAHAMKLRQLLLDVLGRLAARDLKPVVMKGWSLGTRLWPDPLLRPASDIDLLVEPALLGAVEKELVALGLTLHEDPGEDDVFAHHHHLGFHGPRGLVEVHFRLLAGFGGASLGDEAVFARCRPGTLEGFAVRELGATDELVYLSSHAAQHLFLRLAWLVDLKLLIRAEAALDWDAVAALAKASSLGAATHAALLLAKEAVGAEVPASALRALAPTRFHARAVRAAFTDAQLVSAQLAMSPAAAAIRATLSDDPVRATRHLAEGVVRKVRREVANARAKR